MVLRAGRMQASAAPPIPRVDIDFSLTHSLDDVAAHAMAASAHVQAFEHAGVYDFRFVV